MSDQSLGDTTPTQQVPAAFTRAGAPALDLDKPLDLDEVMSAARRPERTARILLRPDLLGDIDELEVKLEERHQLLVSQGSEKPLGDGEVTELATRIEELRHELAASSRSIRVRAMPKDEWQAFIKKHAEDGTVDREEETFFTELIVRCAIRPEMTEDQVKKLRGKLGNTAISNISTAAWFANTQDGLDVPKSRLSSLVLAPQVSS